VAAATGRREGGAGTPWNYGREAAPPNRGTTGARRCRRAVEPRARGGAGEPRNHGREAAPPNRWTTAASRRATTWN